MTPISSEALSDAALVAAFAIFVTSYVVFGIGKFPRFKIDRTGAAIIGAVGMVAFRIVRPGEAVHFIDFGTVVPLFSMMMLSARSGKNPVFLSGELWRVLGHYLASILAGYDGGVCKP
jgi:hypothetical protein